MIFRYNFFLKNTFKNLKNYKKYFIKNKIYLSLKISSNLENQNFKKKIPKAYRFLQAYGKIETPPELDDLIRLHYLICLRRVTTILEFGVGKSTLVFDNALQKNHLRYNSKIKKDKYIRRSNLFECHTVDNQLKWINNVKKKYKTRSIKYYFSKVKMTTFNDRICTFYQKLPVISPDFIYLDGPSRFSACENIRGWTTKYNDGMPMSGDILALEHFLVPGTLIVVDGRSANARFLLKNLQRDWIYSYDKEYDQHFFELSEEPLGIYNKNQLNFCLGKDYFIRLKKKIKL